VIDGESGFILPPFDGQKLSASIAKLAADPALRHSMGVVGRKFALSRFDAGVMVDALQRVYDEVRKRKEMSAKGTRRERQK